MPFWALKGQSPHVQLPLRAQKPYKPIMDPDGPLISSRPITPFRRTPHRPGIGGTWPRLESNLRPVLGENPTISIQPRLVNGGLHRVIWRRNRRFDRMRQLYDALL